MLNTSIRPGDIYQRNTKDGKYKVKIICVSTDNREPLKTYITFSSEFGEILYTDTLHGFLESFERIIINGN